MVLGDIDQNKWSLGLERVKQALERLGHPEKAYRHVLVGGTNGKGSTCIYLERILLASGYRVGTTISPHLTSFTERFRINSCQADEAELEQIRTEIQGVVHDIGLTYFEWCVVLAAVMFARHEVDIGIFEIGLGGRFDASNVMDPAVSVITDISIDHTDYLGSSIRGIAGEKAAIARRGRPLITTAVGEALDVLREHAQNIGADLYEVNQPYPGEVSMKGPVQQLNAALAIRAAQALGVDLSRDRLNTALKEAFLPGRLETIGGKVILDVAHNPSSMLVLVTYLETIGFHGAGVFGVLADKDYMTMIHLLDRVCSHIYIAPVKSERSWGEKEMSACIELGNITRCMSITDAYHQASQTGERIVVTGSFYTVGEVRGSVLCALR
ncbi:MAG TPA: Mur ligase family protein [Deltaproteobacteria bacterium]|nr:Mur ligase family protein [Deltaproteobacteria bacterium]